MPRKKKSKREFKLIAFKAYFDTDRDILDWWEAIEEGERSDEIRELIREAMGIRRARKAPIIDMTELVEVRRDTLWIRDTLNEMPAYIERILQGVTANLSVVDARASPIVKRADPALTDAESQRRERKMRNATW